MRDYVRVNQHAYNVVAPEYRRRTSHCSSEPVEVLAGNLLSYLPKKENNSILEIGPGSGEACRYFALQNNKTTAIDISPAMIENVKKISPTSKVILGDILDIELTPDTYDLVYVEKVIHLFTRCDAVKVMRKIFKLLKSDGILFINTAIFSDSQQGFAEKRKFSTPVKRYRHHYTKSEFKDLIEKSNFRIIKGISTEKDENGKFWQAYIAKKPHAHWWNTLHTKTVDL